MAEIFSIIDLYFPSVIKLELRPVPCPFGRQGLRLGYRCRPWATSSPGPSASPTNDPGAGWTIARAVIGTICSVKHCLWLVYSVVLLPRHTEKSKLHANEMVVTSAYTYYAAVVLVWTFRQLCGWINMREKCCQASEQLKASEECVAKRLLVRKCFEQ